MKEKKFIVVFCHSRAKLLNKCLSSIKNALDIGDWDVIVVHQKGYSNVSKVLDKYKNLINTLISVDAVSNYPLCNINFNRILGTKLAFEIYGADYVLGIEEDNVISKDSLRFISVIYDKFREVKAFRGINLGSLEFGQNVSLEGYSLLRFGLHGSAGVLTKNSWEHIKSKALFEFDVHNPAIAWDSEIEYYLKSGFMVTPNLSRNLDLGYGGTFAPKNKFDKYFISISKSWVKQLPKSPLVYGIEQINHSWRKDAVTYFKLHSIFYYFRQIKYVNKLFSNLEIRKMIFNVINKKY